MQRRQTAREPNATPKTPRSKEGEMKVYGVNACRALWQNRAADIVRVYVEEARLKEFGPLLKWCAEKRKAYHVLTPDDLERVAASVHHEGVLFVAKEPPQVTDATFAAALERAETVCPLLFLDGVANPHNIGAIMRVAAHFGAPLAFGKAGQLPRITPSAARMAEGGMEHVTLGSLASVTDGFAAARKAGFKVVAAASDGEHDLYSTTLPERAILAVGNEVTGLSAPLRKEADITVRISGTGAVESLNVAMAAALLLGEFWRQHRRT